MLRCVMLASPLALLLLLAGPGTTGDKKADKNLEAELKKITGTWNPDSVLYNGVEWAKKTPFRFVVEGEKVTVTGTAEIRLDYAKLKFSLDPRATPKILDMTITEGIQKGLTIEGIYEFKGEDELRICGKYAGKDRPAEFSSPGGSGIVLLIMKREKKKE